MTQPSPSNPAVVDPSPIDLAQAPKAPLLIDVRSGLEYLSGHAPGARNLSLPRLLLGLGAWRGFLPQWFRALPQDQPVANFSGFRKATGTGGAGRTSSHSADNQDALWDGGHELFPGLRGQWHGDKSGWVVG